MQILNAFKTLVKNNIMHRDFKLANILKHDGTIKIADFGFAKILGNEKMTTTMLGSPLNMAPEVLAGREYGNKADIWSIGTCFYEVRANGSCSSGRAPTWPRTSTSCWSTSATTPSKSQKMRKSRRRSRMCSARCS